MKVYFAAPSWRDPGSPAQLTRTQVETLRKASDGHPVIEKNVEVKADGLFTERFDLRENDVWFVEI